jgi:hypothetical protein
MVGLIYYKADILYFDPISLNNVKLKLRCVAADEADFYDEVLNKYGVSKEHIKIIARYTGETFHVLPYLASQGILRTQLLS